MTLLALTDEHARLGKIANNLETHGQSESKVTGFTLPLKLRIPRSQLVGFMGEEFDRCVWVINPTNEIEGGAPWVRRLLPFALEGEVYVGARSEIVVGGNLEPDHGKALEFNDCRVSKIEIAAMGPGGITEVNCHLYVHPGIGSENLLLQEYQEREVAVQITTGKLRVKADKAQQDLPLNEPSAPPNVEPNSTSAPNVDAAQEGETPPLLSDPDNPAVIVDNALRELARGDCPGFVDPQGGDDDPFHIGSPEEEREKAHARERGIAQQLEDAHKRGPGDDGDDDEDEEGMSRIGRQIQAHARKKARA
jgi:hypothetical protein